jgi:predicted Rossmann-fold nucleotide-binding protein
MGFWKPFTGLLEHMRQEAFIRPGLEVRFAVVDEAERIVPAVAEAIAAAGNGRKGDDLPEKF